MPLPIFREADLAKVIQEYKESEEGISQPLESLTDEKHKQIEAKLILQETKGSKKNRILMHPRTNATEVISFETLTRLSQHRPATATQPNIDAVIVFRAYNDVRSLENRVDKVPVMTMDDFKGEVQSLANEAYPNADEPASQAKWNQYVSLITPILSDMPVEHHKLIDEAAHCEKTPQENEDFSDGDLAL